MLVTIYRFLRQVAVSLYEMLREVGLGISPKPIIKSRLMAENIIMCYPSELDITILKDFFNRKLLKLEKSVKLE